MEIRLAKQNCSCRGCKKPLKKGVDVAMFHYSSANRGMNIIFCEECVDEMQNMFEGYKGEGDDI